MENKEQDNKASSSHFGMLVSPTLLEYLSKEGFQLDELLVVFCIETDRRDFISSYLRERSDHQKIALFQRYVRKFLIKEISEIDVDLFDLDNYELTEQGSDLLSNCLYYFTDLETMTSGNFQKESESEISEFNTFIDRFLELWPKRTRNKAGEYLLSNKTDLEKKLKSFFKKYRSYNYDLVLRATEMYLNKQRENGFEYCNAAHYFVSKSSVSKLASECEGILQGNEEQINSFNQLM